MAKSNNLGLILTVIILVLIIYLIYMYSNTPKNIGPSLKISVGEARSRRFGFIIDVRTPKERSVLGYYPNSVPIPLERLREQVPLDISSKNTWILIYSNADSKAGQAAEILYRMGYSNVRYINETYLSLLPGSSY
jgi:rhodanese-related sulfurtransferase